MRRRDKKISSDDSSSVYATRTLYRNKESSSDNRGISGDNEIYESVKSKPLGRKRFDSSSDKAPRKDKKNRKTERKNINATPRKERVCAGTVKLAGKRAVSPLKTKRKNSTKVACNLKEYKLSGNELCKLRVNIS